jgi:glycerate dehydrogenase
MMKIVVLDGYTLNPGDLSWEELGSWESWSFMTEPAAADVVERCRDAAIVFTNKVPVTEEAINQLGSLKYIGVLATGYNIVNTDAARARGIIVSNVPGYGTASVAQMTVALLLELCQHVQHHSEAVKNGRWSESEDFCFWDFPLIELSGKTMGIIGFGTIGQQVAGVARALGMQVIANSRHRNAGQLTEGYRWAGIDELLEQSDVVSIHCPLSPETKGLINKDSLLRMKRSAFLLNTSRGPIIVDQDLADALNAGTIAGAGIDVLSVEPPQKDNPLFKAKNCIITPHIAWATKEARARLMGIAIGNLQAFLAGKPVNVVNQ